MTEMCIRDRFIANGIALLFTSKYYLDKIFRFVMVYLNS